MKRYFFAVVLGFSLMSAGCSQLAALKSAGGYDGPLVVPAEGSLPDVPEAVNYADFWIRQAEDPDAIILSPEEIERFNETNPMNGDYIIDVLGIPDEIDGAPFRKEMAFYARRILDRDYYVTGDIPLERADRLRIVTNMDTLGIPDIIRPRFGVMIRRVMSYYWPTPIPLTGTPGNSEFDSRVVSSLDMSEPVALLYTSRDGRWSYIQCYGFTCWIPSDAVAFGDRETVARLTDRSSPLVAVGHRVSIYGSPDDDAAVGAFEMGSYLPLNTVGSNFCSVLIPGRGENGGLVVRQGFVRRTSDVSLGFLPYTQRNVYRQCFTPFGRRYGWGGMFEERDCSGFTQSVFRCFGFKLPRNSARLVIATPCSIEADKYENATKTETLAACPGGITLVGMRGHIMIYIGTVEGVPYVIHDFWAWRSPTSDPEVNVTHRAARIAVTRLDLGADSKRGSLLDRTNRIAIMANYTLSTQ